MCFIQLPALTSLLRVLQNSHSVLHLCVRVLWGMLVFPRQFMLRMGKQQHSPPFPPQPFPCDFCQMNSDVESWVFERAVDTIIHLVRGYYWTFLPPMPESLYMSNDCTVMTSQHLLRYPGLMAPIVNAPRSGQPNLPSSATLQREVKSAFAQKKGMSCLVLLN